MKYSNNCSILFAVPAYFQMQQLRYLNCPVSAAHYRYYRYLKTFALIGATFCWFMEKSHLEKKWAYYNRYYPEPTQLQKSLSIEAQIAKEREARGFVEQTLEEKKIISGD